MSQPQTYYLRVSPQYTGYHTNPDGSLAGHTPTGILTLGVAHLNPHCPYLSRTIPGATIHTLTSRELEHPMFEGLGVCRKCGGDGRAGSTRRRSTHGS